MHEYSIVQSLLDSCEENALRNGAQKVTKVVVKIGVMSGVEPDLLKTAFDAFKEKTICEDAELVLNVQPLLIKCSECLKESVLEGIKYCCPECESIKVDVIDGEDMYLMQLELE